MWLAGVLSLVVWVLVFWWFGLYLVMLLSFCCVCFVVRLLVLVALSGWGVLLLLVWGVLRCCFGCLLWFIAWLLFKVGRWLLDLGLWCVCCVCC